MTTFFNRFLSASTGVIFVVLWSSASSVTKIGLTVSQPLILAIARFAIASLIMLWIAHMIMRQKMPRGKQIWKQLAIYGFLNVGLYLGLYVLAMTEVSAGLAALFIAINPILIMLISTIWYRQPLKTLTLISFVLCIAGMLLAAYPLLMGSYASVFGMLILFLSNLSYSIGAIYFARQDWQGNHFMTINGWQTLFGGVYLLPFALFFYKPHVNTMGLPFWGSVLWLAIPTSIIAVLIWMALLREDATKASAWLFLCPIAGFIIANVVVKEPLSWYTFAGLALVIAGLYLVQEKKGIKKVL